MSDAVERLEARMMELEVRVAQLEQERAGGGSSRRRGTGDGATAGSTALDSASWTHPYEPAQLEVSETWIELHEPSARPQLQRLVRQVVEEEGPITERLVLDRVRRAWGLRRAGGRVQEAFEQSLRQLLARGLVERAGDALVPQGGGEVRVRVPHGEDEATRRGAEDVPLVELALALRHAAQSTGGSAAEDDLTMAVAKVFGWTRRGGAIQVRLDAAVAHAVAHGEIERRDGRLVAAAES